MTIRNNMLVAAAATFMALGGAAMAQTPVTATTDLNVRAGPGPLHPVTGLLQAGSTVELQGCLEDSKWCRVMAGNGEGWVYSDYLSADIGGSTVVMTERPSGAVPVVTYERPQGGGGAVAGAATGAVAGAIIAGPIGAVAGGIGGAAIGGTAEGLASPPPEKVVTYVDTNRPEPIYLDGEVVVGSSLPDTVVLREIPDYEYQYVYVNGQPVLVEPETRRIVYVMR